MSRDERVVAMLQRLQERFRLYIYTNNNRTLATRIMRATGIEGLFAAVFTIEDYWRAKPDRLALADFFAAIGAEPVACLFVGDRYDVDLRLPEEHGSTGISDDNCCRAADAGRILQHTITGGRKCLKR